MPKDIAVFVGENGETSTLYDPGTILVYQKKQGLWSVIREKDFCLNKELGMKELRRNMAEALDFLEECKVFVGLSVVGLPYYELEKSQCSVWEFQGKPAEFLDYVLEKEEESREEAARQDKGTKPAPVEIAAGCYTFSLKEIQESDTGITSKQALLPFLREGKFYSLELLCNHVPPWLEAEFITGKLSGEIQRIKRDEIKVTITKKCCYQKAH